MTQIRPSLWNLFWAAPFFLIGGGVFLYGLIHGLVHINDSLTQIVVPGHAELSFRQGLKYDVFLEENSVVNGTIYSTTEPINGMTCRVTSVQKGTPIAVERASVNLSYSINERSGHSVLQFFIPEDGRYDFGCDYGANAAGPKVVVAVGAGFGEALFRTLGVSLGGFFGGAISGGIVIVLVISKREREKKRLWQAGQLQGPL